MVALFDDPIAAALACDYCDQAIDPCTSYLDYNLHIDGKLAEAICQMTAQEIIYFYAQMKEDKLNNASDDTGSDIKHQISSYKDRGRQQPQQQ